MRHRPRVRRHLLLALTIVFSAAAPRPAGAEELGVEARGGLGLGSMISQWQRDQGYHSGFVPDLRLGLRVDTAVVAELAAESWFFPRDSRGTGRASFFGGGLRWDPRLASWLTWFLDGHVGLALTGPANRFMFDAGTGVDFWAARGIAFGPFLRYCQVVGHGADPRFWAAGLGATVLFSSVGDEPPALGRRDVAREERQRAWEQTRAPERQSPRLADRDHDGVRDEIDVCPDQQAGPRPDPTRVGCPEPELPAEKPAETLATTQTQPPSIDGHPPDVDSDGDGVPDRDDQCPNRSFGKYPDPLSMGCPLPDRDHDGVPDILDACPKKRGKPSANKRKNGCAAGATCPPPAHAPAHRERWI